MTIETCPICNRPINGDATFFQFHVNSCLDASQYDGPLSESQPLQQEQDANRCATRTTPSHIHLASTLQPVPVPITVQEGETTVKIFGDRQDVGDGQLKFIPVLHRLLNSPDVKHASFLCHPDTQYISVRLLDTTFGCGYRCFQMLYSALLNLSAYTHLFSEHDPVPSLKEVQTIIERAWQQGYDPQGAKHFGGHLVGKHKWIGSTEYYAAFTSLGINVSLYDFEKSDNTSVHVATFVKQYFTQSEPTQGPQSSQSVSASTYGDKGNKRNASETMSAGSCRQTYRQPLILQHSGHSRVVIGFEDADSIQDSCLLVFDPAKRATKLLKDAMTDPDSAKKSKTKAATFSKPSGNVDRLLSAYRVPFKQLKKHPEYQLLHVNPDGPALTPEMQHLRKLPFATHKFR